MLQQLHIVRIFVMPCRLMDTAVSRQRSLHHHREIDREVEGKSLKVPGLSDSSCALGMQAKVT